MTEPAPPPATPEEEAPRPAEPPGADSWAAVWTGLRAWATRWRLELGLFFFVVVVLAFFSSQRFLRQSAAPHFIYQAKAWTEGRLDVDAEVLPNFEDWACVRSEGGQKVRCQGPLRPDDRWYVSFPPFPAVVMLPFVALHGYQFNDTSFTVFVGALAILLFFWLLQFLSKRGDLERGTKENLVLALVLAFGTLFFSCAIRGEVWFTAEVMGVALTALYLRFAVGARRPVWAGIFYSMATLTRTPLMFAGVFFLLEALAPERADRLGQLRALAKDWKGPAKKVALFAAGAAPLALGAAIFNYVRFGKLTEFGHSFFYNNQANAKVDRWGLFDVHYLGRNLEAAFLKLPKLDLEPLRLSYDPHGLSLFLTLPVLVFILVPYARKEGPRPWWLTFGAFTVAGTVLGVAAGSILQALLGFAGQKVALNEMAVAGGFLGLVAGLAFGARTVSDELRRLTLPVAVTVAVCALPGLFYQHTGAMQFGFRFSLDYTPYLLLLFAMSRWSLKSRWVQAAMGLGLLVNFWGAVAFSGYTEWARARGM